MNIRPRFVSFLSLVGMALAAKNPLAMLAARGIDIAPTREKKRKGRGKAARNVYRSGGGKVYGANGAKPIARRLRQIQCGMLTETNGLVR